MISTIFVIATTKSIVLKVRKAGHKDENWTKKTSLIFIELSSLFGGSGPKLYQVAAGGGGGSKCISLKASQTSGFGEHADGWFIFTQRS